MGRVDNLQEELLKTKKVSFSNVLFTVYIQSHAFAMREISILRTKIKSSERHTNQSTQNLCVFKCWPNNNN